MQRPVSMVHVRAPGKINLALCVGAVRPDGYHDLATVFQAVSVFEEVHAHTAREFSVEFTGPIDTSMLTGDDTLVHRAARLVAAELTAQQRSQFGVAGDALPGIRIVVEKHVPIAGGMGGGSADAAATLLACNVIWDAGLEKERLLELAAMLGADVPFSMLGGTALGLDRGDQLTPVLTAGELAWVLVPSTFGLSTPAVYAELDRLRSTGEVPNPIEAVVAPDLFAALRGGKPESLVNALTNDLEAAAFSLSPELQKLASSLAERPEVLRCMVSGSGPTLAILTQAGSDAVRLAEELRSAGLPAVAAHGPVSGAHFVHDTPADQ